MNTIKNFLRIITSWLTWLLPVSFFLLALVIPVKLFNLDFLSYTTILVWPITILTVLFFFRKVFTYLLFSIDEFNFFGLNWHLNNVNEVILEEVNKRFLEEKKEEKRKKDMKKLNDEIGKKEQEIQSARGNASKSLELAHEIVDSWKKSTEEKDKIIKDLENENKRLNDVLSSVSEKFTPETSATAIDETKTSDPVLEETNQ